MENGKAQGSAASSAAKVTATLDIDVSDALRGLKAIQREARKAAQAVRELEAARWTCPCCGRNDENLYGLPYKREDELYKYPLGDDY